jgi:hypothetical protein
VLESRGMKSPADLDGVFANLKTQRPDGTLILGDRLTLGLRAAISSFASEQRLPAVYPLRELVDALMSCGADLRDLFHRVAICR